MTSAATVDRISQDVATFLRRGVIVTDWKCKKLTAQAAKGGYIMPMLSFVKTILPYAKLADTHEYDLLRTLYSFLQQRITPSNFSITTAITKVYTYFFPSAPKAPTIDPQNSCRLLSLPSDLLIKIFSEFTDLEAMGAFSQTCWKARNITADVIAKVPKSASIALSRLCCLTSSLPFENFLGLLKQATYTTPIKLSLKGIRIQSQHFRPLPNDIMQRLQVMLKRFPQVESLTVGRAIELDNSLLKEMLLTLNKLKEFTSKGYLESTKEITWPETLEQFKESRSIYSHNKRCCFTTIEGIGSQCKTLQSMTVELEDFEAHSFTTQLNTAATLKFDALQELLINEACVSSVNALLLRCAKLQKLALGSFTLDDERKIELPPSLQELALGRRIDPSHLPQLLAQPQLKSLSLAQFLGTNVSSLFKKPEIYITKELVALMPRALESLDITFALFQNNGNQVLRTLSRHLPRLKKLSLAHAKLSIESFRNVIFPKVEELHVRGNSNTLLDFAALKKSFPRLSTLDLEKIKHVPAFAIQQWGFALYPVINKQLEMGLVVGTVYE